MKLKFLVLVLILTIFSGCSIFNRDRTGYEDSDSVADLAMPPELNLPKRDSNYDIPEVEEVAPQASSEVSEQLDVAVDAVAEEVEEVVEKSE